MVKKEAGNKNKKSGATGDQASNNFFKKRVRNPWAIRVTSNNKDNCQTSKIIK